MTSSLLRIRDFNLMYVGRLFGTFGMQMLGVIIGWHVYELTNDPFAIGLVGLFQFLPSVGLALFAGEFADQFDRARLLTLTHFLGVVCAGLLCIATLADFSVPWVIYLAASLVGVMRIFGAAAGHALLPNVVPQELFPKAVALNSTAFQLATIGGPMLAGFALLLGIKAAYGICTLIMVFATLAHFFIRTRSAGGRRPLTIENLIAGIHFIRSKPVLLGAISLDLFAVLFGGVVALLPVFAKDILQVGPEGLGLLRSAPAVGAALVAFALTHFTPQRRMGFWMLVSVGIFGVSTILFGISTSPVFSWIMLLVLGGADMVSVYIRQQLAQVNTPDDMRGRVASVNMLFITASNELGDFESGLMASWLGAAPAVVVGGVLSLLVVGFIGWRVPSLAKLDKISV